jgi:hypothetical protein
MKSGRTLRHVRHAITPKGQFLVTGAWAWIAHAATIAATAAHGLSFFEREFIHNAQIDFFNRIGNDSGSMWGRSHHHHQRQPPIPRS